ncbi:MAG: hypothetical protein M3Q07_19535 [Pseudobdellovibrionaceae bacterium]|nr:hypothetical protein [Pseudobdellovibrionaceae bacterium]
MYEKIRISSLFLVLAVSLGLACSSSKQTPSDPEEGKTEVEGEKGDVSNKEEILEDDKKSDDVKPEDNKTPQPFSIPDIVSKLTWKAQFFYDKIFTGFDGTNSFKVLVEFAVTGTSPEIGKLTKEQLQQLLVSPEYRQARLAEKAKLSLVADAAFLTSKMLPDNPAGKVVELTTVKAGSTILKGRYGAMELSLPVTITAYTPAQVAAGKQRYDTAVGGANPSPSCASCHKTPDGVDHSPNYLTEYSDAGTLSFVETGFNSDIQFQTEVPHKMTFAGAGDKAGIVAYLRSLDPNLLPEEQGQ